MKSKNNFTMNIKRTGRCFLAVLAIACTVSACKKEKNEEPVPPPVNPVDTIRVTKVVTETFTDATPVSSLKDYPEVLAGGLTTTAGSRWFSPQLDALYWLKGNRFDGTLLSANKNYLYWLYNNLKSDYNDINTKGLKIKQLKKVSITFAASQMTGEFTTGDAPYIISPFDPTKHYFQISLKLMTEPLAVELFSPKFTKTGEWITAVIAIPNRAALITAYHKLRVDTDNDDMTPAEEGEVIDAFLEGQFSRDNFSFYNNSTRNVASNGVQRAPIVIEKIDFGFVD